MTIKNNLKTSLVIAKQFITYVFKNTTYYLKTNPKLYRIRF